MQWITPDWPAPVRIKAAVTLRAGGVSKEPFDSLNLALHVGDDPSAVAENRRLLREALQLPSEPTWLNQVHGTNVISATTEPAAVPTADASVALTPGPVCVVMTADCLPVLFCDRAGTRVAAAHAGWRGLVGGVLEQTIQALQTDPSGLMAWLGPAIEPEAFEVGPEVRDEFVARDTNNSAAFQRNDRGRWQADLYMLARNELHRLGINDVYGGGLRCYADNERFFSYRRAGLTQGRTGRMATLIWLDPS